MKMKHMSRREIGLLVPALAAAQTGTSKAGLPSKAFDFDQLPVKTNATNKQRPVFRGETTRGLPLEMHETELAPGTMPHPAHSHAHEELLVLLEGKLEVTISGAKSNVGTNSVVFVASGEEHGWRNADDSAARYYVIAVGRD